MPSYIELNKNQTLPSASSAGVVVLGINSTGKITLVDSNGTSNLINTTIFATTGSNTFSGSQIITGSLALNGNVIDRPYKVYTALLTQNGTSAPAVNNNSTQDALIVGQSYYISVNDNLEGDFTNVGAASNAVGTYFVATGTTPAAWGSNTELSYDTGAPVATVLENTIGLVWWEIRGDNTYQLHIPNSDITNAYISSHAWYNSNTDVNYTLAVDPGGAGSSHAVTLTPVNITNSTIDTSVLINTPIEVRIYN